MKLLNKLAYFLVPMIAINHWYRFSDDRVEYPFSKCWDIAVGEVQAKYTGEYTVVD